MQKKNGYTASDGKTYQVAFYNLDVVISVGYRVKSVQGIRFRQWATSVLKEYLLRGYSVNLRMNQLEDTMHRNLAKHEDRIAALEHKVDFFVQAQTPPCPVLFGCILRLIAKIKIFCKSRNVAVDFLLFSGSPQNFQGNWLGPTGKSV